MKSKSNKSKVKSKLPKYNSGVPYAGIASAVQGVSGLFGTEDKSSFGSYTGTILGDVGQYAGLGATFGQWGAAAGAALGVGTGIAKAINADKAQQLAENKEAANKLYSENKAISDSMRASYDVRNQSNRRVPGLKKGVSSFDANEFIGINPNAMVANGEVIRDGITGSLSVVPGAYDSSNPDKVPALLSEGSSVYSKQKSQILPGGKSTPADLASRATALQEKMDKKINGRKILSKLERDTIDANMRNIENMTSNLNKFNSIINVDQVETSSLPKFQGGIAYYTLDRRGSKSYMDIRGLSPAEISKFKQETITEDQMKSIRRKDGSLPSWISEAPILDNSKTFNAVKGDATRQFKEDKFENTGWMVNASEDPFGAKAMELSRKAQTTVPPLKPGIEQPSVQVSNNVNVSQTGPVGQKQISKPAPIEQYSVDPNTGMAFANVKNPLSLDSSPSGTSSTQSNTIGQQEKITPTVSSNLVSDDSDSYRYDKMDYLKAPNLKLDLTKNLNIGDITGGASSTLSDSIDTDRKRIEREMADRELDNELPEFGNRLSSFGNKLMSLAPIAYNAKNTAPEVASPIYDRHMNIVERYDVSPQLAESTKQRNIARYNAASSGSGYDMAMASDIYSKGVDQLGRIMNMAEVENSKYRSQYADRYNDYQSRISAEDRRIYDINVMNRAAARSVEANNMEMLSRYGQTQELMQNQAYADLFNSNIWGAYASAVDKGTKDKLSKMIDSYAGRLGVNINRKI